MPEETRQDEPVETEQESPNEAKSNTVTILGHTIQKRTWTNRDLDEWTRISDHHGVDDARKKILALQGQNSQLSNKRIELQEKTLARLEEKLDTQFDKDDWDEDAIAQLQARIIEEAAKLDELQAEHAPHFAEASFSIGQRIQEANAAVFEAHLEMAHYLAGRPGTFQEWSDAATKADYNAAAELVSAGNAPFARRHRNPGGGNDKS